MNLNLDQWILDLANKKHGSIEDFLVKFAEHVISSVLQGVEEYAKLRDLRKVQPEAGCRDE